MIPKVKKRKAAPVTIQEAGRRGGLARKANITPAAATAHAKKAALARWGGLTREERIAERAKGRKVA